MNQQHYNYHIDAAADFRHFACYRMGKKTPQTLMSRFPVAGLVIPVCVLVSSAFAQEPGVKFRGDLPIPAQPAPVTPGAVSETELPDPMPVIPGSRIVDPAKPGQNPETTPPPLPPQPQPTLPGGAPADPNQPPIVPDQLNPGMPIPANPENAPALPNPDVPQIENINLFPDEAQQMANAVDEFEKGWKLVWHGGIRVGYNSNIFIQDQHEESDLIVSISPGAAVGIGDFRQELASPGTFLNRFDRTDADQRKRYFFLDYNPTGHIFTNNDDESSFEHDVRAEFRYTFTKLTLGATARFETLNVPDVDLGERVKQRRFNGRVEAEYAITGKTTLEVNFDHNTRDYEGDRTDIAEYRASAWIDYQAAPKTHLALGYTHGWVEVDNGNGADFDQLQLRAIWRATEKFSARLAGGVESRSIDNGDDVTNATFSAGIVYKPYDATSIFLNGFRRTTTSASGFNETFTTTGFDIRVIQRFSQKYFVTAAGGVQQADYEENVLNFSRQDDYSWARLSLGWDVNKWLTALVAWEFRSNDSNQLNRSFDEHLLYLQLSYLF